MPSEMLNSEQKAYQGGEGSYRESNKGTKKVIKKSSIIRRMEWTKRNRVRDFKV